MFLLSIINEGVYLIMNLLFKIKKRAYLIM